MMPVVGMLSYTDLLRMQRAVEDADNVRVDGFNICLLLLRQVMAIVIISPLSTIKETGWKFCQQFHALPVCEGELLGL
jgi:hypothetical protein